MCEQNKEKSNATKAKCKVHETPHDCSLIPTIAVSLWLGGMGALTYALIYTALFATPIQRNIIISILAISFILPPSFPGETGVKIGSWIMQEARKYFGLKVVIENEDAFHKINKSGKTAIFAVEPHDVLPYGVFAFHSSLNILPGRMGETCRVLMTGAVFKLPIIKHVYTWVGGLPVDKKTFRSQLANNLGTAFVPGGVQEVTLMDPKRPNDLILYLQSRKGFVKLALERGNPIVPVFLFNLDNSYGSIVPKGEFFANMGRKIGFLPLFFWGRFGIPFGIPNPVKLSIVFGEPLEVPCEGDNISPASVEKYHALYLEKVKELFERHKDAEGYGHRNLVIL